MSNWRKNKPLKRQREAQKLSYKLEDGKVLNFYSDENFPARINALPYKNELELYKRIFLSVALRFYKVYNIDDYNDLKDSIYRILSDSFSCRDLIDEAEEVLECMDEALEEVEPVVNLDSIYFKKGDDIIIKDCISEMTNLIQAIKNCKFKENYRSKFKNSLKESSPSFQSLKKEIKELYEDIDAYYMIDDEYINSFIDEIEHANKSELIDGVNDILDLIDDIDDDSDSSYYLEEYKDQFEKILNKLI